MDLALEIGKSSNYINSIENGKYFPSPETIEEIAAVLEIEPIRLFDQETSQSNEKILDLKVIETQLQEIIARDIKQIFADSSLFSSPYNENDQDLRC